jgi:hypothetical protein
MTDTTTQRTVIDIRATAATGDSGSDSSRPRFVSEIACPSRTIAADALDGSPIPGRRGVGSIDSRIVSDSAMTL